MPCLSSGASFATKMQTASAQSSCNWSFPDSLQQLSLQRGAVQLHTLQGSLQRGGFPPPLLAVLGKALLHLHDGPGLAARSSKLGAGGRSAQARCRRPPHCPLGAVVPQSPAAACRGRCCAARRGPAAAPREAAGREAGAGRGRCSPRSATGCSTPTRTRATTSCGECGGGGGGARPPEVALSPSCGPSERCWALSPRGLLLPRSHSAGGSCGQSRGVLAYSFGSCTGAVRTVKAWSISLMRGS